MDGPISRVAEERNQRSNPQLTGHHDQRCPLGHWVRRPKHKALSSFAYAANKSVKRLDYTSCSQGVPDGFLTTETNEKAANLDLAGLSLAPLVVKVNPNLNVVLTAFLTVYETMSKEHTDCFIKLFSLKGGFRSYMGCILLA
ncbi:hypothetical protein ACP70R_025551 [Stipagrostis hirtigluma subsp. patula]